MTESLHAVFAKASSFRDVLSAALEQRKRRNPRYSLRSFARDLEMSPARLSETLDPSRKQGLSAVSARKIAAALKLDTTQTEFFCDLVESEHGRSPAARKVAVRRLVAWRSATMFTQMQADAFAMIAEWHHLALVELTFLESFRADTTWIAAMLGISAEEASAAVERLLRVGALREDGERGLVAVSNRRQVDSPVPSSAVRSFHRSVLGKAQEALDGQSMSERTMRSVFMPVRPEQVAKVREMMRAFQNQVLDEATGAKGGATEVYCLAAQFFRLAPSGRKEADASIQ